MADAATISVTATMLPDEIAKTMTGSMTVTPSTTGLGGKWYYKETTVLTSAILLAGYFLGETLALHVSNDFVDFLFIRNAGTATAQDAYITLDGGASTATVVDGIVIGFGESWFGRMPSTPVAQIIAFAGTSTTLIVAALIEDAA